MANDAQNQVNDPDKENIIAAKQAISPKGLMDQSTEGNSGPAAEIDAPQLPHNETEETYMNGDEPAENLPMTHPNRNADGKAELNKPSYGGGH
jgi:hypothetical protein